MKSPRMLGLLTLLGGFLVSQALGEYPQFPVAVGPYTQAKPKTDGQTIVWCDGRAGSGQRDVYAFDLASGSEQAISVAPDKQGNPDVSGNFVVWQDRRSGQWDIYGYDVAARQEFPISTQAGDQHYPRVSGNYVVWADWRRADPLDVDIYGYDLSTRQEFPICTINRHQDLPVLDGNIVVWEDSRHGRRDLYGYDLSSRQEFEISVKADAYHYQPDISGQTVVWMDSAEATAGVFAMDLTTREEVVIATPPDGSTYYHPAISGSVVVWTEIKLGRDDGFLHGFDLGNGRHFVLADDIEPLDPIDISGSLVVFEKADQTETYWDVYALNIPEPGVLVLLAAGAVPILRGIRTRRRARSQWHA